MVRTIAGWKHTGRMFFLEVSPSQSSRKRTDVSDTIEKHPNFHDFSKSCHNSILDEFPETKTSHFNIISTDPLSRLVYVFSLFDRTHKLKRVENNKSIIII